MYTVQLFTELAVTPEHVKLHRNTVSKLLRWIANDLLVVFQEVIHNLLHIGSTQTLS